jgi:site-specific DNA-cytosine methylase
MRVYAPCIFSIVITQMTLTVLSLFDGISCGQLALQQLGIDCVYYTSEVDKYAINVTRTNFPNTFHTQSILISNSIPIPPSQTQTKFSK